MGSSTYVDRDKYIPIHSMNGLWYILESHIMYHSSYNRTTTSNSERVPYL